jgi:hypothetical protein
MTFKLLQEITDMMLDLLVMFKLLASHPFLLWCKILELQGLYYEDTQDLSPFPQEH